MDEKTLLTGIIILERLAFAVYASNVAVARLLVIFAR